jgi:hypothetical protein
LAALTAASMRARRSSGASPAGSDPVSALARRASAGTSLARTIASIRPGRNLEHDGVADAGVAQLVLDVLGEHVEAVGEHDHVARPAAEDEASGGVEMPGVARVVPALGVEHRGGRLGVVPVALEQRRSPEQDLALGRDPELERRHRPAHRAEAAVVGRVRGSEGGLGRPVALEHGDAERLPGELQRRRQVRADAHEQAEVRTEALLVEVAEQAPPQPEREV